MRRPRGPTPIADGRRRIASCKDIARGWNLPFCSVDKYVIGGVQFSRRNVKPARDLRRGCPCDLDGPKRATLCPETPRFAAKASYTKCLCPRSIITCIRSMRWKICKVESAFRGRRAVNEHVTVSRQSSANFPPDALRLMSTVTRWSAFALGSDCTSVLTAAPKLTMNPVFVSARVRSIRKRPSDEYGDHRQHA